MDEYDQTEVRRPRRRLPPFYYLDNFKELLAFVEAHYAHVLLAAHRDFVDAFRRLPLEAQALYVRIHGRKGTIFRLADYRYPEIGNVSQAAELLLQAGFVRAAGSQDFAELLHYLKKDVLLKHAMSSGVKRSWKKSDCIDYIFATVAADDFVSSLGAARPFAQERVAAIEFIEFLYHGRLPDGTSRLTLRDLGVVDNNDVTNFKARFQDYEEAFECYFFARELRTLARPRVGDMDKLCRRHSQWPAALTAAPARLRDQLALELGRYSEAQQHQERALEFYRAGESADCLRSAVRLFTALKRQAEAKSYLEARLDAPRNDEEQLVATDLYRRKFNGRKRSIATVFLQEAESIELDEAWLGAPERGAEEYYSKRGYAAFRTENTLWRTLFGLLFWDLLFGEKHGVVHSPLDHLPATLAEGVFYAQHAAAIEARLAQLEDRPATLQRLLRVSTDNYGQRNSVFRWRSDALGPIKTLLDGASAAAIASVLRRLCQDYRRNRAGYPDLMLAKDGAVRFIELKAAGDQLRRQQLLTLNCMNEAGLSAEVVRVDWCVDPDQVYVVVDVETTGGRGPQHRVTEIGAVKVQHGAVVDRFSTLLNPQRLIPPSITRITRISNQMVEDAPIFADVADSFRQFLEGAIFCAHNVNFDYGFLRQEFARLGQAFRYPKLCTCASMRKLYRGHRSYSLAALTAAYDIPLENHHRALCDAEAAAQLLLLINEKRISAAPDV